MKKYKAILSVGMAVCIIFGLLSGCQSAKANDEGAVLAVGGDKSILMDDYTYFYYSNKNYTEEYLLGSGQYTEDNIVDFWKEESEGTTMGALLQEESLNTAKDYSVFYDLAKKANVELTEEEIKVIDDEITDMNSNLTTDEEYIANYGLTVDRLRTVFLRIDTVNKYIDKVYEDTEISQEEQLSEYEANLGQYQLVTVRHILITTSSDMTEEEQAEAKKQAEELLARIENGEDIGELAAQYSEDGGSSQNNGEYTFGKGEMVQEFEEWAFSAKEGDKAIVETYYGYHIMQCMKAQSTKPFEEVKDELEYNLRVSASNAKLYELLEENSVEWEVDDKLYNSVGI